MPPIARPMFTLHDSLKLEIIEKKIVYGKPLQLLLSGGTAGALVPLVPLGFIVLNFSLFLFDFQLPPWSLIFTQALTYLRSATLFIPISIALGMVSIYVKRYSLEKKKYVQFYFSPAAAYVGPWFPGKVRLTADFFIMAVLVPAIILIYDIYLWSGALGIVIACLGMLYSIAWELINDWLLDFVPFNEPRLVKEIVTEAIYKDAQVYRIPTDLSVEVLDDLAVKVSGTPETKYDRDAIIAAIKKVRGISGVQDRDLRIKSS